MRTCLLAEWSWALPEPPVDSWWLCAIVLIVLVIFIWLIARLTASSTEDIDPAEIHRQMLTTVSELRSRGELTQEEYRSIKSRLVDRLSDESHSEDSEDSSHEDKQQKVSRGQSNSATETHEGTTDSADSAEADRPYTSQNQVSDEAQSDHDGN